VAEGETTAEHERLPTQTIQKDEDPSETSLPVLAAEPPAQSVMTATSPFAGLLAEAKAPAPPNSAPNPGISPFAPASMRSGSTANAGPIPQMGNEASQARTEVKAPATGTSTERRIGPYRVLEELGSGGMAIVYKALQPSLDRLVAIKELRPEYVNDRQIAARFSREAASLATLQHGNIVHIFDYIFDYESAHIVMEYVEGIDLFDMLAACDRVPAEVAAIIATQVGEGLEYAHYRGIVHRDIKPSNILVSKKGEVKVMDFGIARDPGNSELTQVGIAVGTPAYMAPEQIRGDRIDARTDIFAVGIVLYEMLAGEKPWAEEEGRSITVKVLDEAYTPIQQRLDSVPEELATVIDRCLEKDPKDRYQSMYEVRRDLELFVNRVVPSDPRGRVVLFLRNRSLITEGEASSFVSPDLLADASLRRRDQGIPLPPARALMKPAAIASAAAFGALLVAALLGAFLPYGHRLPDDRPKVVLSGGPALSLLPAVQKDIPEKVEPQPQPEEEALPPGDAPRLGALQGGVQKTLVGNEGFVRVIVEPWARVFVDGELFDVTPFAQSIPLPPGQHRLAFRNPYFKPLDKYVDVAAGKTEVLKVTLAPKDEGDEAEDAKPE
jgi:serine/threonine-protein kinase